MMMIMMMLMLLLLLLLLLMMMTMIMTMFTLVRSRDQVCASTKLNIKFLHFVLSWVSSLQGRRIPFRFRL
jgi:hypothetical protein